MAEVSATNTGPAQAAYSRMKPERDPYLIRARACAQLTIPTLFREEGDNGTTQTIVPYNSIGAYCANNLASKIIFALFPAGRSPFKAEQDRRTAQDLLALAEAERAKIKLIIDQGLSKIEQDTSKAIEEDGDRARMFVAALRLLIGGSHALQFYPDGTIRGIPLERHTVRRDGQGTVLEFCLEDPMDWDSLDDDIQQLIAEKGVLPENDKDSNKPKPVTVYWHGRWKNNRYRVYQEVCGVTIPGSEAAYVKEALPFLFLPWILLDGEHYGRSYCEFYQGDLQTTEGLTATITEGAAAMARFLLMVNPTWMTNKKAVATARNGDVITGREEDVVALIAGKGGDFQIAQSTLEAALNRLAKAFLLQSAVQRKGERVTAEEIREVASELEDALGGVYSQQVITWQAPYVKLKLAALQRAKRVAPLPKGAVKITVTAGLAALGRNAELTSLRTLTGLIQESLGAEAVTQFMKGRELMIRMCTALGIDPEGLINTEEEMSQKDQAAQLQQMIERMGPEALKQLGNNVTSNQVANTNADAKMATAAPTAAPEAGA